MRRSIIPLVILSLLIGGTVVQAAPLVDNAGLDSQSAYPTINKGDSARIFIVIKNTGTTTWSSSQGYTYTASGPWTQRWGTQNPIWQDVGPGQTLTFADNVGSDQDVGGYDYGVLIQHNGQNIGPYFYIHLTVQSGYTIITPNGITPVSAPQPPSYPSNNLSSAVTDPITVTGIAECGVAGTAQLPFDGRSPQFGLCSSVTLTANGVTYPDYVFSSTGAGFNNTFTFNNIPRGATATLVIHTATFSGACSVGPVQLSPLFRGGTYDFSVQFCSAEGSLSG